MPTAHDDLAKQQDLRMSAWRRELLAPCDVASVAFFRIAFGCIMLAHVADCRAQ